VTFVVAAASIRFAALLHQSCLTVTDDGFAAQFRDLGNSCHAGEDWPGGPSIAFGN
jgi:hypothetical protein